MSSFSQRVQTLPVLGLGVSTEYGAGDSKESLDVLRLNQQYPRFARFLEVGVETTKGIDGHAEAWIKQGLPTTYHFLDINLDDPEDFTERWLAQVQELAKRINPAWMCGDAGLWHFGRRDRAHMLLLPPILSLDSATAMAQGVQLLRQQTGFEVLPENPPGTCFVGPLHLLEFFAQLLDQADTGMLLDCAHLAIFQHMRGHDPLTGLDNFPLDRIVEIHIAGGTHSSHNGLSYIDDTHTADVLPDTWSIFESLVPRCPNLKAVVFECERNPLEDCLEGLQHISNILEGSSLAS